MVTSGHCSSLFFLLLCSCFTGSWAQDAPVMLELKASLLKSSATSLLDSWKNDTSPCNWTGIHCNLQGNVTEINLSSKRLAGELPLESICRLASLEKLFMGKNSLYGNISNGFTNCKKLQYLDLAFNSFTGSFPDLSNLSELKLLNLSDNGFSGPFPTTSLRNKPNLVSLSLGDNPFDPSPFPEEILALSQLSWLYLSNCGLSGRIPQDIGNVTELVNLELSDNSFYGEIPASISKLSKLWQLELYNNSLNGTIPVGFGNLVNLQKFDASMNYLDGGLTELKSLTKLVSLQLFYNQFSGEIPVEFGEFRELVNLSLYSNNLSGPLPQKLGSWSEFYFIDVSENGFTGPIPPDMCLKGKMTFLLMLDNKLSGELPSTYATCSSMNRLRVSNNSLSGKISAGIWGLPKLEIIDFAMNQFEGEVGLEIRNAKSLTELYIQNNRFSGQLWSEISQASSLIEINASVNEIEGEIPATIGELPKLNKLHLQDNKFSGKIPDTIGSCASLSDINLAGNQLVGQIPASLASIQVLNSLNLSENQLSGEIPTRFSVVRFSLLDLSNNQLTGPIPQGLESEAYADGLAGNSGLCSQNLHYFRQCVSNSGDPNVITIIVCLVIGTTILVVLLASFLFLKRRSSKNFSSKSSWNLKSFHILTFTEREILNSLKEENLIGQGGSGEVYRVDLSDGKTLAVKQIWIQPKENEDFTTSVSMLKKRRSSNSQEIEAEVSALSEIRHVNVVKLYCSISGEESQLLVYDYMPNGSLWDRLHGSEKCELDWDRRYQIALGAAKGLEYLHHGCRRPVVHRDVKSSNILIDEFFEARIADFGLAKVVQRVGSREVSRSVAGTLGYMAPEYAYSSNVSEKTDVYSFGVVLMELVTGKRPIQPEFGVHGDIVMWVSSKMTSRESVLGVVDSRIQESMREEAVKVLRIAVLCTSRLPALRPTMRGVVQMLLDADPYYSYPILKIKIVGKEND
ncbi:hypothetical protein AMTRI_Chr13g123170 [Amborella trichopoda]